MLEDLLHAAQQLSADGLPSEVPAELPRHVPPDLTWEDVANELVGSNASGDAASLRALQACLAAVDLDAAGPSGDVSDILQKIGQFVDRSIRPVCKAHDENEDDDHQAEWQALQVKAEIGLQVLTTLARAREDGLPSRLGPAVLCSAAAYTNAARDPWTTPLAARLARDLLEGGPLARPPADRARFLADDLLAGLLRPLFARSRPATVTASGRKAEFVEPTPQAVHEDPALKPWKHEHRYAVAIFEWVVSVSDQDILAKSWPAYTPILLTLLDSAETELKTRALHIFGDFWARCPPGLMDRVGLNSVFEDAVFPAVLYLPSLTPEDESLRLLDAAYPALAQLAGLSHAPPPSPLQGRSTNQTDELETERIITTPDLTAQQRKLLDKIVREGVMTGHFHARDYTQLTTLFCEELHLLVSGMGILATKYLKDLMPMVSEILIDPFGTQHLPTLRAATRLLQTIMRSCWPRMPNYCNDILKMLTICWLNTEDEEDSQFPLAGKLELREQLTRAAATLYAIMGASDTDTSFRDLVAPLVQKEPTLRGLLSVPSSTTD